MTYIYQDLLDITWLARRKLSDALILPPQESICLPCRDFMAKMEAAC